MMHSKPFRSALYVPASKPRAMAKAETLPCDAVIFDLEDAVAPAAKSEAREALRAHFSAHPNADRFRIIRINALSSPYGTEDFMAARAAMPDAILLPKVERPADIDLLAMALEETDAPSSLELWAMIETPMGVINAAQLALYQTSKGRQLSGLVVGTNDLMKESGVHDDGTRRHLHPWLMQIVLAARAGGQIVLDGVLNDFSNDTLLNQQCRQAFEMGFDGKTLIHPAQIALANDAFMPSAAELAQAQAVIDAFADPENLAAGLATVNGAMVELLHLMQAKALIARHEAIVQRQSGSLGQEGKNV